MFRGLACYLRAGHAVNKSCTVHAYCAWPRCATKCAPKSGVLGEPADSAVQLSSTGDIASDVALLRQSLDEVNFPGHLYSSKTSV